MLNLTETSNKLYVLDEEEEIYIALSQKHYKNKNISSYVQIGHIYKFCRSD